MNILEINQKLDKMQPAEIVKWSLEISKNPIITTNFRPYESAILHLVSRIKPDIPVIWCDTGYNTTDTYRFANELINSLNLNIQIYAPKQTRAYRDFMLGIPEVDTPEHRLFSEQVKLEPFKRAMAEWQPDLWFTNLRHGQTDFRDKIGILSSGKNNELKVSPFYHFSDTDLDVYLAEFNLPNEERYYDPTKALAHRECGIHA